MRPDTAAQLGRATGAEYLVLGSVTEFGVDTTGAREWRAVRRRDGEILCM